MPEFNFNQSKVQIEFPAVMGILNLTPDSFSDGGLFLEPERACEHAHQMVEERSSNYRSRCGKHASGQFSNKRTGGIE